MAQVWGIDIGVTSIGWAAIDDAPGREPIKGMGVRIFPEARDAEGTPLNQTRQRKRLTRRQFRRRRERRKTLNQMLGEAGLLPPFSKEKGSGWSRVMAMPPLPIRARALEEPVEPHELGRALYHLAKRRHFKGRDLEESDAPDKDADARKAEGARERTSAALAASGQTLGQMLAAKGPRERTRGAHAQRSDVAAEFERLWQAQAKHHPSLDAALKSRVADVIFAQKPVFWRKSTLGECRLMPGGELAPKGSWLSQQRRMLEKLNNLEIASGNRRPLDAGERAAILGKLQTQASMSWGSVRKALKPPFAARGEPEMQAGVRFNLELGGEPALLGNPLESKLSAIFGDTWTDHPHRQAIRDAVHRLLWSADYGEVGTQRVVILSPGEREAGRAKAARRLAEDFGVTPAQADALAALRLPAGWEPYSTEALRSILPELERGERFGALMVSPEHASWRDAMFPARHAPTGEELRRLPSPARRKRPDGGWDGSEEDRLKAVRNPTVARAQNELRKVVNNLLGAYGRPDLIRVELAREVGLSKREREERAKGINTNADRRAKAKKDLDSNGIAIPSERDITKWILWKEGRERCPYTGDPICFDALFRRGAFEVEHIWPRSRSLDDSQGNKTLCRKDVNIEKGNRTPHEYFQSRPAGEWDAVKRRLDEMTARKGGNGIPRGKVKRFLAEAMPDDFTSRQLNDTGYAARQAVAQLKRLWPDRGAEAPVKVQAVTGKVTAQLRKLWGLNNILSDNGEKTRADHRHHAVDALAVACAHPGVTQLLSRYWQDKDQDAAAPQLAPPWPHIRDSARRAVAAIVVSHRVRKKVSGPLHEETIRGDTGIDVWKNGQRYRLVVARKKVEKLTTKELASDTAIADPEVRRTLRAWVAQHGGDPAKAFAAYPTVKGKAPIKRVRLREGRQTGLMVPLANGLADPAGNHHVAIRRNQTGAISHETVSRIEAARRLARREPVVRRVDPGGSLVMSLAPGDTVHIPEGDRAGYWTMRSVYANGQIVLARVEDATETSVFRPRADPLLKLGARKVSIDPIGRVRRAND